MIREPAGASSEREGREGSKLDFCSFCIPLLHWWNVWGLAMGVKAAYSHEKRRISKYFAAIDAQELSARCKIF
jgi:hypothetical protein